MIAPQIKVVQLETFFLLTSKLGNMVNKEGGEGPLENQDLISVSTEKAVPDPENPH